MGLARRWVGATTLSFSVLAVTACGDDAATGGGGPGTGGATSSSTTAATASTSGPGGGEGGIGGEGGEATGAGGEGGEGGGMPLVCGDGTIGPTEECDDGNTTPGDGCDDACLVEPFYACRGEPSVCTPTFTCGDGMTEGPELCDDANLETGDGCDDLCAIEPGWACTGEPSVCTSSCGDGITAGSEACDDGTLDDGDGCSAACAIEDGWSCSGAPSTCATTCGDDVVAGSETCDDGNGQDGDCCSAGCAVEAGCEIEPNDVPAQANEISTVAVSGAIDAFVSPSGDEDVFTFTVPPGGTGALTAETLDGVLGGACALNQVNTFLSLLDPGGTPIVSDDDGGMGLCSVLVQGGLPPGKYYLVVTAGPSFPAATFDYQLATSIDVAFCQDGIVQTGEVCDDGNATSGDGCSPFCTEEIGYDCIGSPSVCGPQCADGIVLTGEACDDANTSDGDGCSASCQIEPGFGCVGSPSLCSTSCGDGIIAGAEGCDDGNAVAGDGCSNSCAAEAGFDCSGSPSVCSPICGDGIAVGTETCDDGNAVSGDCCSACASEPGCEIEPNDNGGQATEFATLAGGAAVKAVIKPIGDHDFYMLTTTTVVDVRAETFDGTGAPSCLSIDTYLRMYDENGVQLGVDDDDGPGNCSVIQASTDTFARQLPAGTYFFSVEEFGNNALINLYQVNISFTAVCGNGVAEGFEQCDGGPFCTATCQNIHVCGNGVVSGTEACDDTNTSPGDGCSATCQVEPGFTCSGSPSVCSPSCGNNVLDASESCDDPAPAENGDGCSLTCAVEPGYQCGSLAPSVCSPQESNCSNGADDDGDGAADAVDADCAVPAYFPACGPGQTLRVYRSVDAPSAIPDNNPTGITRQIAVPDSLTIAKLAVRYNIAHTYDSDLDISLIRPNSQALDVCSDVGSSGDNFNATVLDSTCATSVTTGTAPFAGCYQPETSFAPLAGTNAQGVWKLRIADDAGADTGTLQSWALILCTNP